MLTGYHPHSGGIIVKMGNVKKRIRNQLRIHWGWLKKIEDYNDVADFIDNCINQVMKKGQL